MRACLMKGLSYASKEAWMSTNIILLNILKSNILLYFNKSISWRIDDTREVAHDIVLRVGPRPLQVGARTSMQRRRRGRRLSTQYPPNGARARSLHSYCFAARSRIHVLRQWSSSWTFVVGCSAPMRVIHALHQWECVTASHQESTCPRGGNALTWCAVTSLGPDGPSAEVASLRDPRFCCGTHRWVPLCLSHKYKSLVNFLTEASLGNFSDSTWMLL